ncbi:MAG: hypothetical protein E7009_03675 [Alphaproteobacteria bacterium]|nr:hypothetical protein [Alphaproteobacteria bacterium]MBQ3039659.1 hypothetical protein [Alphaproteobacteria bacterium]MBQ7127711.1 hypothetical protein [Alphaproteobacteria bacterium]
MKLNSIAFLTTTAIILSCGTANANLLFDVYAGATAGVGASAKFIDDKYHEHSAQSYGAVFGLDIPLFRIEAEYNYLNGHDTTMNLGMVNAYFKVPTPILKPYFGAGLGTTFDSKYEPSVGSSITMDNAITYQGMIGLTLDLPVIPVKFDVEGRVLYANNVYEIANEMVDIMHYDARVKLRYIF